MPISNRNSQLSHGLSTFSRRSMARSVALALWATFSESAVFLNRMNLSDSPDFFDLLAHWTDHSRCVLARSVRSERLAW